MYYTEDQDLIDDFHLKSGHSVGSIKSYRQIHKIPQHESMRPVG